jgi:spore maturation protein B
MLADFCELLSDWALPLMLLVIPLAGYCRRVRVYEAFVSGAADGFHTAVRIMPFLVAMMVAINVFRVSGALDACVTIIQPLLQACGVPDALVPLAIMRPLSGTGALGLTTELLSSQGPDSLVGLMASVLLGSTDTTFYILTVYFGAVGIQKPRYSLFVGLGGDLAGFIGSVYICRLLFSQ